MLKQDQMSSMAGPILIVGAGGFIGANAYRQIAKHRKDIFVGVRREKNWRLPKISKSKMLLLDSEPEQNAHKISELLKRHKIRTIWYFAAYGAYSSQENLADIYDTNFKALYHLLDKLNPGEIDAFVHAGSSSEYGNNSDGPSEQSLLLPNSHYSVSKAAASLLISFFGQVKRIPIINLRLYSVYGPYEDENRLIPQIVKFGLQKKYPPLTDPKTARDFVYIDDVIDAFADASIKVEKDQSCWGLSINIGYGRQVTIKNVAETARNVFNIKAEPNFNSFDARRWDLNHWFANTQTASEKLGWTAKTDLTQGLNLFSKWFLKHPDVYANIKCPDGIERKKLRVAAIVACYKDNLAIPIMYDELVEAFQIADVDYQIIFVNDCSPDDSEILIQEISARDKNVMGITHSRNFGSQMAFKSGLEFCEADACIFLDGDLQDPPKVIPKFIAEWNKGYDIVVGSRKNRDATLFLKVSYKLFYRLFDWMADIPISRDAGDFSLFSKRAYSVLLTAPERDLFIRGLRSYLGFKHTSVDYHRPERKFGKTTNSLLMNFNWAKKAIFSYSTLPINLLTLSSLFLFFISFLAMVMLVLKTLIFQNAPEGIPLIVTLTLFFGGLNMAAVAIIGEYISRIFIEVKNRPGFVRESVIKNGVIDREIEITKRIPEDI